MGTQPLASRPDDHQKHLQPPPLAGRGKRHQQRLCHGGGMARGRVLDQQRFRKHLAIKTFVKRTFQDFYLNSINLIIDKLTMEE
jgi:hypothetical protein